MEVPADEKRRYLSDDIGEDWPLLMEVIFFVDGENDDGLSLFPVVDVNEDDGGEFLWTGRIAIDGESCLLVW